MSKMSEECELFFYEEITPLKENRQFWLVRHKQTGKYYVKKNLTFAHREVYETLMETTSQNLPRINECISLDNEFIVIEEFINGDTLEELVRQRKITPEWAVSIMTDICNVLFILHSMRPPIIHRDIKPENIMLTNDGVVKLIDFDIARTYHQEKNRDTEYMGTIGYAAPEHFGFGQTDAKSDIYSCGVLLNYLLTGRMPDEKLAEGTLGTIINKCIQLNPVHRYQNVFELRQDLNWSQAKPIPMVPYSTPYTARNPIQGSIEDSAHPSSVLPSSNNGTGNITAEQKSPAYARDWQKFLPPGFRTLKLWKMLVALFFYYIILNVAITGDFEANSATELLLTRIFSGIGMICSVLVLFNYLGITDKLPGAASTHSSRFKVIRCIYAFLALCIMLSVAVILESLLQ